MCEYIEALERNGVARINGVFNKDEINDLRGLSWKAFRDAADGSIQWRGHFPALLFSPTGLDKFRTDERLAKIARSILGDNILQLNNQVYFRLPGDGDQFAWHQDISFRIPKEKFNQIETGYLQTAIVIDPMRRENSPIEFVYGSHKKGELNLVPRNGSEQGLRSFRDWEFAGRPMCAEPGDVLIWSVMTVHGSRINKSNWPRMYYMNGLAKAECVIGNEFPWYMKDGKIV
jgi:ectoine hydroxylase-related dioxygenase (phytanoyl-CoA dioxygenase family)